MRPGPSTKGPINELGWRPSSAVIIQQETQGKHTQLAFLSIYCVALTIILNPSSNPVGQILIIILMEKKKKMKKMLGKEHLGQ